MGAIQTTGQLRLSQIRQLALRYGEYGYLHWCESSVEGAESLIYFAILLNRAKLRTMKVEKGKFDALLGKLLKTKPEPRKKIKTRGRRGSKAPILSKP